jgi:hypothetical protein
MHSSQHGETSDCTHWPEAQARAGEACLAGRIADMKRGELPRIIRFGFYRRAFGVDGDKIAIHDSRSADESRWCNGNCDWRLVGSQAELFATRGIYLGSWRIIGPPEPQRVAAMQVAVNRHLAKNSGV